MKPPHKWAALGLLLLALGAWKGKSMYSLIRGLRNNNPGNLERNGVPWEGLSKRQDDERFYQFQSPEYGIRALGKVLLNYQRLHDLDTVRRIIDRYAPPFENDTGAYIEAVALRLGVSPDQPLNVAGALPVLVESIIKHENGLQPYSGAFIIDSLRLIDGWNPGENHV